MDLSADDIKNQDWDQILQALRRQPLPPFQNKLWLSFVFCLYIVLTHLIKNNFVYIWFKTVGIWLLLHDI